MLANLLSTNSTSQWCCQSSTTVHVFGTNCMSTSLSQFNGLQQKWLLETGMQTVISSYNYLIGSASQPGANAKNYPRWSVNHSSPFFPSHRNLHLRHNHHLPLSWPLTRTNAHKSSFAVGVIPFWNSLPPLPPYCPFTKL